MYVTRKEIGAPRPKENKIDVPGNDGSIDLTDFFGEPKYDNVRHKFEFVTFGSQSEFLKRYSTIKNAIHGKKVRIILDDDPAFFYTGRCHVSSFTSEKGVGTISVECDCEPYKYKLSKTVVTRAVNGTDNIVLTNSRKRAVPEITATAPMTIVFGGGSWANAAGTFVIPELELVEGENHVTVTGTGSITFAWQEGEL